MTYEEWGEEDAQAGLVVAQEMYVDWTADREALLRQRDETNRGWHDDHLYLLNQRDYQRRKRKWAIREARGAFSAALEWEWRAEKAEVLLKDRCADLDYEYNERLKAEAEANRLRSYIDGNDKDAEIEALEARVKAIKELLRHDGHETQGRPHHMICDYCAWMEATP